MVTLDDVKSLQKKNTETEADFLEQKIDILYQLYSILLLEIMKLKGVWNTIRVGRRTLH